MKYNHPKIKKVILFRGSISTVSGVERIMFEEAKYLVQKGIETYILTFELQREAKLTFELLQQIEMVNIEEIPYKRVSNGLLQRSYMLYALRKKIKEIKPDIIIVQETAACPDLYLATLFTRFSYVTHVHDVPFQSYNSLTKYGLVFRRVFDEIRRSEIGGKKGHMLPKPPKMGLLKRGRFEVAALTQYLGVRKARKIFTLSNQVKWMVKKLYGKEAVVLKGTFSADKLNYKPQRNIKDKLGLQDKMVILNVNTLRPEKRIDLLLSAFKVLTRNLENVVLIIGGSGLEEERLKNLTQDLSITDKVMFMGYIREEELWDYYACCDVFVHPFQGDFAIAPYEPLALQKKVVVPKEMELDEYLIKNKHVFVADPTVEGLAKTIKKALTTEVSERYDLSDYTWEKYVERIYASCKDVVI
jgi:glycosyltransferase involved in cell wall biosynthesis